jgi:Spy/CpxP family protein refolding chaperone
VILRRACLTLALLTWAALPALAQHPPHVPQPAHEPGMHDDDPIGHNLFPPELIMRYQQDIALAPEQRTAITKAIQEFQNKTVELQWQMQDQTQRMATLLGKPSIDETAALQQLDQVLNVEREVKRAHIGLLIKLKNTLTADQQAKLAAHREPGEEF